jgi:hypothetical protein
MIEPYFVEKQLQTWTGWNPYDEANPVRRSSKCGVNFLENFQDFSFWKWDSPKELCQIIIFNQEKEEVGYIGYYPDGFCVSIYVDPKFRCRGFGSKLISLVPNLKVFQEDVGSFNKKANKQDPLHSREYLLEWYSKKGVLR